MMGGLVVEHVVSRSVRDSAAILDVTAGPVPGDPYWAPPLRGESFAAAAATAPPRLRVAVMAASPTGSEVHADCVAAVRAAAALCESLGHQVEEAALSVDGDAFTAHFINQWACSNAWAIGDWEDRVGRTATEDDVEPLSWSLIELGRSVNGGQYLASVKELQRISRQIADYFEGIDVLLTPTLGEPPAPLGTFDSPPGEPLTGLLPRRGIRAVHPAVQRDGTARDLAAAALERRRAADRRAVRRPLRRRGDAALARRPARAGIAVGGAPAAGPGLGGTGAVVHQDAARPRVDGGHALVAVDAQ